MGGEWNTAASGNGMVESVNGLRLLFLGLIWIRCDLGILQLFVQ